MVSVIIPVYNTEKYLDECFKSVISQTYDDIEIIVVDDGSTDGSPALCDEYARQDSRVTVIHKPNGGVSSARNTGLDAVKGDWVLFVDSDDTIESNAIELLCRLQKETSADLTIGMYTLVNEDGTPRSESKEVFSEGVITEEQFWQYAGKKYLSVLTPTFKLYKASIWEDGLRYPIGLINEDQYMLPSIVPKCKKIVCTNNVIYKYRYNDSSIMRKKFNWKRLDAIEAYIIILEYLYGKGIEDAEREYAQLGMRLLGKVRSLGHMTKEQKDLLKDKYTRFCEKLVRVTPVSAKGHLQYFLFLRYFSLYSVLHRIRDRREELL